MKRYPQILNQHVGISADSNYDCKVCPDDVYGFQVHEQTGRIFKFPPTLCSEGIVPFAFAGLNPRISDSNRGKLFNVITSDREAFVALAKNRTPDGEPYVRMKGGERHYHTHVRILHEATLGTEFEGQRFEDLAVCTELFMCATPPRKTVALIASLRDGSAACPGLHFWKAIVRAAPKVVVTLGDDVLEYVRGFARREKSVYRLNTPTAPVIVAIPHPGRRRLPETELKRVAEACRGILFGEAPEVWDFRRPQCDSVLIEPHSFGWSDRYGWQVKHRPADLAWLEADRSRKITYLLHKDGKPLYRLSLNGSQLRAALGKYVDGPKWPTIGYVNPVTKTVDHARTEEFLPQWAHYVTKVS
jgi:hypothetical protein